METIELLQILDNVLDEFDNKSNLKYHLLKEQIENKILIIKNLICYGFPVLNYTHQEQLEILYCLKFAGKIADIDNMIDNILNNIYESSGYQLLLTNIPTNAETRSIKDTVDTVDAEDANAKDSIGITEPVNAERMYDTLEVYIGEDNIESVFRVSSDIYLAKFQLDSDAVQIANLINNKMIENNIINVKYIAQIANFKDSMYIDDSIMYVETECDKYEKEFKDIEILDLLTEPKSNDEYKYIEPIISSNSIENIESLDKPVEYKIDDININKDVREASVARDDTFVVYERKSLIGVLFTNIVGSISNKFNTIYRYFSNK